MAASDNLSPQQFAHDPNEFHPDDRYHSPHDGGKLWYPEGVQGKAEPRCTACGHRVTDPRNNHVPVETRYLGPARWVSELPMREIAKRHGGM